jgi:hypothetical protein
MSIAVVSPYIVHKYPRMDAASLESAQCTISTKVIRKKLVEYIVQCSQDSQDSCDSPVANPLVCSDLRELQTAIKSTIVWRATTIPAVAP